MKKKIFTTLAASLLALSGAAAIAPSFIAKAKEVGATDAHVHADETEFVTPLNNAFFSSSASHGWVNDTYTLPAGSYYLSEDITLDYDFTLKVESEVKLCLNGKSVYGVVGADKTIFHVDGEEASLVIDDCDDHVHHFFGEPEVPYEYDYYYGKVMDNHDGGNLFYGGYITNLTNPIVTVDNGGSFIMKGGNIIGGRYSGQFNINDNSSAVFEGGFIGGSLNDNPYGAINLRDHARVEFKGGFECYDAQSRGSGAAVTGTEETELIIGESTFRSNQTDWYGGAIHTFGHIEIDGATFIGNYSEHGGGAIYLSRIEESKGGEFKINNATFESNSGGLPEGQFGGAIHVELTKKITDSSDKSGTLSITNSSFTQNNAPEKGGAISFEDKSGSSSYFNIENCTFENNYSDDHHNPEGELGLGGAIYYKAFTFSEKGTKAHLNIKGSSFDQNNANEGGAIALYSRPYSTLDAVIEDTEIENCNADRCGGAMLASCDGEIGDMRLTLKGTTNITGNYSFTKASGVYASNVLVKLGGSVYVKNNGWSDLYIPSPSGGISRAIDPNNQGTYVDILEGGLTGNALVGIDMEEPGDFSKTLASGVAKANLSHFTSNVNGYFVNINKSNNQLMLSTQPPTPDPGPGGDATPSTKPVYNKDGVEVGVPSDFNMPSNVEIRVEIRADVNEISDEVAYSKIKEKLSEGEYIAKVFDVRLIKIEGGVETEIQPSDLAMGLPLKIKINLPKDVSKKGLKVLHIHNVDDMEFVDYGKVKDGAVTFTVTRLSQFAFINSSKAGLAGWAIALIVIGSLIGVCGILFLLAFFVLNKWIIIEQDEIVRAFRTGKESEHIRLRTMKFKLHYRFKEEVFKSKKDAEDFLKSQTKK